MGAFKLSTAVLCPISVFKGTYATTLYCFQFGKISPFYWGNDGNIFAEDTWQLYYKMILGLLRNVEIIKDTILNPQESI